MQTRIYLTEEESLRLKKLLESVERFLLNKCPSSLSIQIARQRLNELTPVLAPTSEVKRLIDRFLDLSEGPGAAGGKNDEMFTVVNRLKSVCNLTDIRFLHRDRFAEGDVGL